MYDEAQGRVGFPGVVAASAGGSTGVAVVVGGLMVLAIPGVQWLAQKQVAFLTWLFTDSDGDAQSTQAGAPTNNRVPIDGGVSDLSDGASDVGGSSLP